MDTIKRGSLFPQSQKTVVRYDPQTGIVVENDFNGAGQPEMQALFYDAIQSGIAGQITYENDKASLQTTDSTQQTTLDTWQIVGNEDSPDILTHPTILAFNLDSKDTATMRRACSDDNVIKWDDVYAKMNDTDNGDALKKFFDLYKRGSQQYRKAQYVIRHSTNCPSRNLPNIADVGIETIYTFARLLSEVQSSALWLFPMPANLVYQISNIPVPTGRDGYRFGWLKSPPTKTTSANNRIDITTEYTLELWSLTLYPDPT